jgi:hypothetical protein
VNRKKRRKKGRGLKNQKDPGKPRNTERINLKRSLVRREVALLQISIHITTKLLDIQLVNRKGKFYTRPQLGSNLTQTPADPPKKVFSSPFLLL